MNGIYQTCYDLIASGIFGGVEVGSYQELVTILVSVTACLFLASLPFILVWRIIKLIGGR